LAGNILASAQDFRILERLLQEFRFEEGAHIELEEL